MIALGQVVDDDSLFPTRVFVPCDLVLVHQQDVHLAVRIHVSQLNPVSYADLIVDRLHLEFGAFGKKRA